MTTDGFCKGMVLVVIFFLIFEIIIFGFVVAMWDQVHDVETVFHPP